MRHPATKRRDADPQVPAKSNHHMPHDAAERQLEQGLEESMAGSDPVSVVLPPTPARPDKRGKRRTKH